MAHLGGDLHAVSAPISYILVIQRLAYHFQSSEISSSTGCLLLCVVVIHKDWQVSKDFLLVLHIN